MSIRPASGRGERIDSGCLWNYQSRERYRKIHLKNQESSLPEGITVNSTALYGKQSFTIYEALVKTAGFILLSCVLFWVYGPDPALEYTAQAGMPLVVPGPGDENLAAVAWRFSVFFLFVRRQKQHGKGDWAEELFRKSFMLLPIPAAISTIKDGILKEANGEFLAFHGYEREDVIGRGMLDLGVWVHPEQRVEIIGELVEKGAVRNIQIELQDRHGAVRNCLYFADKIRYDNEDHILSMVFDITDRIRAGDALKSSEERYRAMFEHMLNGVAVYRAIARGEDFVFLGFNEASEKIDHISSKEVVGRTIGEVFPFSRECGLFDALRRVWETGDPEYLPECLCKENRTEGWREYFVYKLPSGELVSLCNDRTAQRKAEEELTESRRELMTLMGNLPGMVYRCRNDRDWTMDFVSEGCTQITGYSPADLISSRKVPYAQLIHPDDRDMVWDTIQAAVKEKKHFQVVYRIRTAKGTERWVREQGVGVFSPGGDVTALEGFITDITEQRQSQDALKRSEEKFSKAFHASPDWITISTLKDGFYVDVNEAFLANTGYDLGEVIGRTSKELGIWENPEDRARTLQKMTEQGWLRNEEVRFRTKPGQIRTILFSAEFFEFGGEECILSVSRDVTEHKRLEAELRQSQKMEAVGQLAGGIAHDFNNILASISSYSELVLHYIELGKPIEQYMKRIIEIESTAKSLIRQLMAFSRNQVLEPQEFDLNEVVRNMKNLLDPLLGAHIELEVVLDREACLLSADRSQVEQIIMNVAINARDAMPGGGLFRIETARVYLDQLFAQRHTCLKPGGYIRLTFSDTGDGMDEETMSHIFEPFFTTKEEGKGTGLGLSTVYGIIKQSGGDI